MKVMMCGAADVKPLLNDFISVLSGFGADHSSYIDASHYHEDTLTGSSIRNSRISVKEADLCVFVIMQKVGAITWNEEMDEAWWAGKPIIVMCRQDTYEAFDRYRNESQWPEKDMEVFRLLHMLETERNITIVQFADGMFANRFKEKLIARFKEYANEHEVTQRRKNLIFRLHDETKLSSFDIEQLIDTAKDDYENKNIRKDAVKALAQRHCLGWETVIELLRSYEQGVARITCDLLDRLMMQEMYTQEFLNECVDVMNATDDTGVERRLVQKLLTIDLTKGLKALQNYNVVEIGSKRRLAAELENHKEEIISCGLQEDAIYLAEECHKTAEKGWRDECQKFIYELKESMHDQKTEGQLDTGV